MTEQQREKAKRAADAMLAAAGFHDIERGDGWYTSGHAVQLDGAAQPAEVAADVAEHWRAVARTVAELPAGYPHRAFLEHWAETGSRTGSGKACGLSEWEAREAVRKFKVLMKRRRVA